MQTIGFESLRASSRPQRPAARAARATVGAAAAAAAAAAPRSRPISLSSPSTLSTSSSTSTSSSSRPLQPPAGARRCRRGETSPVVAPRASSSQSSSSSSSSTEKTKLQPFPSSLDEAIRMARKATRAALDSGAVSVAEVEMPSSALYAVMGDAEGANEMTYSAELLRDFVREWEPRLGGRVRVFFPDRAELAVVTRGRGMDPAAGSAGVAASFAQTSCSLDFLTDPTFLGDMGLDVKKRDASALFDPDGGGQRDELLVVAYPSFNVNEMIAVDDAWKAMTARRAAKAGGGDSSSSKPPPPVIIFNGELERIYSGYYPPMFYRRLAKVASAKDGGVLASAGSDATYYIKNFKGLNPGILYRCWPGPWQVLRRRLRPDGSDGGTVCVWSSEERPSLKKVSLEILTRSEYQ